MTAGKSSLKSKEENAILYSIEFDLEERYCTLLDEEEKVDASAVLEARDRLKALLICNDYPLGTSISRYLVDTGYQEIDAANLFDRYPTLMKPSPLEKLPPDKVWEILLDYYFKDSIDFFRQVLNNDKEDPQFSAIGCEEWFHNYLVCKKLSETVSVKEFFFQLGFSKMQVDQFYESYRAECLYWQGGHPRPPVYENETLYVYLVDGIWVAAIEEYIDGYIIAPKGAEFTANRMAKWVERLTLLFLPRPEEMVGKTEKELIALLGPVHVFVTLSGQKDVPGYLTERGYLIGFFFSDGKVSSFKTIDLLKTKPLKSGSRKKRLSITVRD